MATPGAPAVSTTDVGGRAANAPAAASAARAAASAAAPFDLSAASASSKPAEAGRSIPPVGSVGRRILDVSKSVAATIGIGSGRGSASAAATRPRPNSTAEKRSSASGRPARSRTAASEPRSADTGISLPTRAASVDTVESAENGTAPVTASSSERASE